MTAKDILDKYIQFFEERGHTRIENSSLVPLNDPTTLFTSSGMQPLVPFLLGETHPSGVRLVNAQNCFRAQDIDGIGDNRHTTFFRMLGNWSLGDYFKKEQIPWLFEFLTTELNIPAEKLYVTVFEGYEEIPKDTEAEDIWRELFKAKGLNPDERIFFYGVEKNWWSRAGVPANMPTGEPGGPDTEVFYDTGNTHDSEFGEKCHVNCDCGRYIEIGNSVFMQYIKRDTGFENLPKQNVDFGGGLERLVAATENKNDMFQTSLFWPIMEFVEGLSGASYKDNNRAMRIIADHIIGSVFMVSNDVFPSNKDQGYILRRLLRRAIRYGKQIGISEFFTGRIADKVIEVYSETDAQLIDKKESIKKIFLEEEEKFSNVIHEGLKRSEKIFSSLTPIPDDQYSKLMQIDDKKEIFRDIYSGKSVDLSKYNLALTNSQISDATVSGKQAFDLQQSFGFPTDMVVELAQENRLLVDVESAREEIKKHQDLSRAGAAQKFAGGLADHSELTVKGHTATHLMHQALRDVLGNSASQTGSNITSERVRFDFTYDRKLTEEEITKVTEIVRQKIKEDLSVHFEIMPLQKAKDLGAIGLFDEKYGNDVKIYFIGDYSMEFCGGPHVEHTSEILTFDILKEEGVARGVRRVYAKVS